VREGGREPGREQKVGGKRKRRFDVVLPVLALPALHSITLPHPPYQGRARLNGKMRRNSSNGARSRN